MDGDIRADHEHSSKKQKQWHVPKGVRIIELIQQIKPKFDPKHILNPYILKDSS